MAAESGLPALIVFLSLIGFILYRALQAFYKQEGIDEVILLGLLTGIMTWLIHNLANLDDPYMNNAIWVILGMLVGLTAKSTKEAHDKREAK
jgi:O-antigen ligase